MVCPLLFFNCAAGSNAGMHAVCKAGTNTYAYDLNGNLTNGGGRTIVWTAWNMPASLTQDGSTTSWLYGPERERYKMATPGRTTWYLNPSVHQGGHYEQTRYASGTVEHRHTIYGGGKPVGEFLTFTAEGTAPAAQTRYFHSDAQGSITAVTDQNGQVITRYRYDPWGKQTLVSGSNIGIDATRQGHTGHEMLDGGLTHMNGRLYDPVLSRFVSADPIVQAPYDLQSLNRYSYVMNNPLYYTDPTGFSAWTDFRDGFLKPVLSIAASIYLPGSSLFTSMGLTGTSGIIAAGAVSGAITGGGRGALTGAVSAGMFSQLHGMSPGIGKIAAHGVVGGMMSEMQGGSFKSGFLAAGFTQALSPAIGRIDGGTAGVSLQRTLAAAIVGGTASVIGGGKFANGAMTGAFSRLFNDDNRQADVLKQNANRAAGLSANGSQPPQVTYTYGYSFGAMVGPVGYVGEVGIAKSADGTTCLYTQACGIAGLGLFVGGGHSVGIQDGTDLSEGHQDQSGAVLMGGYRAAGDIQITRDKSGNTSAVKGFGGNGGGLAGGKISCTTSNHICFSK